MNCTHHSTLTYEFTKADRNDFTQLLGDVLSSGEHEISKNFRTPSIRGHRSRSMQATTNQSGPTTETNMIESETEDDFPSYDKRGSSTKHRLRKTLVIPT